MTSATR